jgi:hypothetical protein
MEMDLLAPIIVTALVLCFMTQIVVHDAIFEAPRDKVLNWLEDGGPVRRWSHKLLSCHRCAGVWLSPFATMLVLQQWPWDDWSDFGIVFAAASYAQWAIMQAVDRLDEK